MRSFYVLADALSYIEQNLCSPIEQADIAAAAHVSLSGLQKLFRHALHASIKEYIDKRRLTMASRDIQAGGATLLEIAMKYQYNSPEVFGRAFARMWGIAPSMYKQKWRFAELYPRQELIVLNGEESDIMSKRFDLGELYDELQRRRDCYVLCFDIKGLYGINEISREAGDMVILEALSRIERAAGEDMLLFRVGGDEFALVTGLGDQGRVNAIGMDVLKQNGEPVRWNDREIPVVLWASAVRYQGGAVDREGLHEHFKQICELGKMDAGSVAFVET